MSPTTLYRRDKDSKDSKSIDIFFISSVLILSGLVLCAVVYKCIQRLRRRRQAPRDWSPRQRWDVLSICPLAPRVSPEPVIVGVWMADDVNPKFIHRVTLNDLSHISKLVDNEGYIYVIADPEQDLMGEKPQSDGQQDSVQAVPVITGHRISP